VGGAVAAALILAAFQLRPSPPPVIAGDLAGARGSAPGLRILFVGNSLTSRNELPDLLSRLVAADPSGRHVFAVRFAQDGANLALNAMSRDLDRLLREVPWDVVVLQEASRIPSLPEAVRHQVMDGPAQYLAQVALGIGARPLLFATWGYRDGDPAARGTDSFAAMEGRLERGYASAARGLNVPVAPVGLAWATAVARDRSANLWQEDGLHPTIQGSYLAACVFAAVLYQQRPDSSFDAGLPAAVARAYQQDAWNAVEAAS
jgi:hypothetical protein